MKRWLLVFLAICAFAVALVPKNRRAVNAEEQTTTERPTVCEHQTACAWSVYKAHLKLIDYNLTNTFCRCGSGTICVQDGEDQAGTMSVYRCREPGHGENEADN